MFKQLLIALIIGLLAFYGNAQINDDFDFHSPLGIPLILSSNFGELRPNHFHMGIDLKTNGTTGYKIYSIDDGYVSRVKVSPYGYGKAVYIDHPNGLTSVYAHCLEFKGEIDSIVRSVQQEEQNFAIEFYPKKNEIRVKKGQVIAISGNSGGSTAPHVHFEIRDTKTEHALNPLLFGFDLADHKAPEIRNVKIYGVSKDGYRYPGKEKRYTVGKGKSYFLNDGKITVPANYLTKSGGLGFAFDVIDRLDGASNRCGLYGSVLIIDGDTIYGQQSDRIPFESTRYVNSHKDFEEYVVNKRKFHKCFRTSENDLPIYIRSNNGVFHTQPKSVHKVHYIAYDIKNNRSELKFDLVILPGEMNADESIAQGEHYLFPSQTMGVEGKDNIVELGKQTTYEPMRVNKEHIDHTIGEAELPVQSAYRITFNKVKPKSNYVEFKTAKDRTRTYKLLAEEGIYYCEPKYFGTYMLKSDSTAPSVRSVNFTTTTTSYGRKTMQWRISDDQTGIEDYDLFIDGKWVLLEYDYKTDLVTFDCSELKGEKDIKLIVTDEVGNKKEWKSRINFL